MMPLINTTTYRERFVVARKPHRCEDYACHRTIAVGETYLLCTEYPGGDAGYADSAGHPVRLKVCRECSPQKFEAVA